MQNLLTASDLRKLHGEEEDEKLISAADFWTLE